MNRTHNADVSPSIERLLIVSDIHSFLQPLDAFDAAQKNDSRSSQIIFNGDAFFGGPHPAEVAEWIQNRAGEFAVLGNHDDGMLLESDSNEPPFKEAGAHARLSAEQIDYFKNLPHQLNVSWLGYSIVLRHGHITASGKDGSWRATPNEQADNFADSAADLCVTGHTHFPFINTENGTILANAGSMAAIILASEVEGTYHVQSGEKEIDSNADKRSSYLEVTEKDGKLIVELIRFEYDKQSALADLKKAGCPENEWNYMKGWLEKGFVKF